jgi:hypothetical protein
MIAYCPLDELEPPSRPKVPVVETEPEVKEVVKPQVGLEETEMNYVIMGFIVGIIMLAVSDSIRA